VASRAQAIASEHRKYRDRSERRIGNIERERDLDGTVGPRAYAGRLIDFDTALLVLSQQLEPVRDIDKQAVDKDLQSRETTLPATRLWPANQAD
jgi:hypothetical protein